MKTLLFSILTMTLIACSQQPYTKPSVNTPNPESAKQRSDKAHGELDREMR